ncbi:MAG: hypothetical protein PVG22_02350 [Chromatiales bacterium]
MTRLRWIWFPLLLVPLVVLHIASAADPEQDIVAIDSTAPLDRPDSLPGLITGQRIMDALQNIMDLLQSRVAAAERPGVQELITELRQLQRGEGPDSPLPASYQTGGELWLPVRAEQLKVRLDAPDLRLRPQTRSQGGNVGNLTARAQRVTWLPVGSTLQHLESLLSLLGASEPDQIEARRLLETALHGVRTRTELQDRPLILAYYQVEAALAAVHDWSQTVRGGLRHSAERLAEQADWQDLARQLQAEADRLTPDLLSLQKLAMTLRKRIEAAADSDSTGSPDA